ncbi:uncharacterized protein I206_104153 [Kwoniella pini CBS 10737]|uniref:Acetoin reductase n=1 Tax=Kwoniella pini CBS 10737 TaxID=1296096 RepID=A0A1B9I2Q5_9TREE|nr:uncharacterized protein I206_04272 [Kwoniella pini CBS 10737]OCF49748.1 hypothetical protein I206_04272 [Kwoniella pini CBS 10737]
MVSSISSAKKVAIITGAAQGIGKAIAIRLSEDGYNISLADLPSSSKLLEEVKAEIVSKGHGTDVITVQVDVSNEKEVYDLVDKTVQQLGRVDVMVANAGIAPVTPFLELSVNTLDKVYQVNVRGVFLCYQAAAKQMIKQGEGGRLIGACSMSGLRTGANMSAYCSSKFAVRAINQGAAVELGKYGITANVYCPTVVETEMWNKIDDGMSKVKGTQKGKYTEIRANLNPLGRNATPEDIAAMVS